MLPPYAIGATGDPNTDWWQRGPYQNGIGLTGYSTNYNTPWYSLGTTGGMDTYGMMNQIYNPTANQSLYYQLADYGNMMNSRYNPYTNPIWGFENPYMSTGMSPFQGFGSYPQTNPLMNMISPIFNAPMPSGGGGTGNPLLGALFNAHGG